MTLKKILKAFIALSFMIKTKDELTVSYLLALHFHGIYYILVVTFADNWSRIADEMCQHPRNQRQCGESLDSFIRCSFFFFLFFELAHG